MSKAGKIKAEIERLKKSLPWGSCASQISMECNCKNEAYNEVLSYIDSLEEGPVSEDLEYASEKYACRFSSSKYGHDKVKDAFITGAQWQKEQIVLNDNNKEYHRVPSTTLKRLYMNETKYELLKSDIIEGIVGDFEKGTIHNYLTIKIPMLLCPSNCAKGDKVKLIIVKEE